MITKIRTILCLSNLHIYIRKAKETGRNIGLVWFHDISTIVDYLMPNLVYSYILKIHVICKDIL